jgi:hypothetical protein
MGKRSVQIKQRYGGILYKSEWDSPFIAEDMYESREGVWDWPSQTSRVSQTASQNFRLIQAMITFEVATGFYLYAQQESLQSQDQLLQQARMYSRLL